MLQYTNNRSEFITEVRQKPNDEKIVLSFKWPASIEQVYIFKTKTSQPFSIEEAQINTAKLYTLDEYQNFKGYTEDIKEINQYRYSIYPFVRENGEDIIYVQSGDENTIIVDAGKVQIRYSILEKKSFFTNKKQIQIVVSPDMPLLKDVICYVIKKGGYPSSINDGLVYSFVDDFEPGENRLPLLTILKDEYIAIFLTNADKHKNIYSLKLC